MAEDIRIVTYEEFEDFIDNISETVEELASRVIILEGESDGGWI